MSRRLHLREVDHAARTLAARRMCWRTGMDQVHAAFGRHRIAWLLGGGFLGGLGSGLLPVRPLATWLRTASSLAMLLLRSPLLAAAVGAGWRRAEATQEEPRT